MSYSHAWVILYTSSILVEIMLLSQLFFHMLTLQALQVIVMVVTWVFLEPVSLIHAQYISALGVSAQQCWVSLRTAAHYEE